MIKNEGKRLTVRNIQGILFAFEKQDNGLYNAHILKHSGDLDMNYFTNFKTIKEAVLYIEKSILDEEKAGYYFIREVYNT